MYAYTTSIHSQHTSASRTVEKHDAFRRAHIPPNECNYLDLQSNERAEASKIPFMKLHRLFVRGLRP